MTGAAEKAKATTGKARLTLFVLGRYETLSLEDPDHLIAGTAWTGSDTDLAYPSLFVKANPQVD